MKPYFTEKEDDENYQFYLANDFAVDDDLSVYILDFKECVAKKYDKGGKFVLSFGRKGKGPGEIFLPLGIQFSTGKIYIPQYQRLDVFTTKGVYEKTLSYPQNTFANVCKIIDGKFGVVYGMTRDKLELITYSLNEPDQKIKTIASSDVTIDESGSVTAENEILFDVTKNNEIIFGLNNELKIEKYSILENSQKTIINYNYTRKKHPEEWITAMMKNRKKLGRTNLPPLSEYYPMLSQLSVDDNDNIWLTIISNEKSGLMRFDKNGKFLDDYSLRRQNYYIGGGKIIIKKNFIYSLNNSEDEGFIILRGNLN